MKEVKVTREDLERLHEDRKHYFTKGDYKVLIKTRDRRAQAFNTDKYIDLCYYDNNDKEWKGVLDIDKVPLQEAKRLGTLYKNPEVVLFCELKDVDDIIKLSKEEKANREKVEKDIKNKFKNI